MNRMYEDSKQEADSIMGWLERRAEQATSPLTLVIRVKQFDKMWAESFGTYENIPQEFRDKIKSRLKELQKQKGA